MATGLTSGFNRTWCTSSIPRSGGVSCGSLAGQTSANWRNTSANPSRSAAGSYNKCLPAPSGNPYPAACKSSRYSIGEPTRKMFSTTAFNTTAAASSAVCSTTLPPTIYVQLQRLAPLRPTLQVRQTHYNTTRYWALLTAQTTTSYL